jgi:hypothetical protein
LVVAGDAAYNDVHLYLAESNTETRRGWIAVLDTIESLKPRTVIAGHKKPETEDSPRIIEETRQYIRDFDRLARMTTTARELYDEMLQLYPNRANPARCGDRRIRPSRNAIKKKMRTDIRAMRAEGFRGSGDLKLADILKRRRSGYW